MPDLVFDAGAFIAYERNDERVRDLIRLATTGELSIATSSAAVAQVWRDGSRQARLARLFAGDDIDEEGVDPGAARQVGLRCAASSTSDVVDAHLAVIADRSDAAVVTSDPDDFERLGIPRARIVTC